MITDPDQRAAYLAQHYWDNFNFADTIYVHVDLYLVWFCQYFIYRHLAGWDGCSCSAKEIDDNEIWCAGNGWRCISVCFISNDHRYDSWIIRIGYADIFCS